MNDETLLARLLEAALDDIKNLRADNAICLEALTEIAVGSDTDGNRTFPRDIARCALERIEDASEQRAVFGKVPS